MARPSPEEAPVIMATLLRRRGEATTVMIESREFRKAGAEAKLQQVSTDFDGETEQEKKSKTRDDKKV